MKPYIKKHLRELIWFSFLNDTYIFLSHEIFELLYICYKKKKVTLDEKSLRLMLKKTIFDSIEKDDEGEIRWISKNNKKFRVLIKNDLLFLKYRSEKIIKKWFLISYKQFIKITYEFNYDDEDIDFFELIMEIDDEYKKMLLKCNNMGLILEDEVYSILNVNTDNYIDDSETIKSETGCDSDGSDFWDESWDEEEEDKYAATEVISLNGNLAQENYMVPKPEILAIANIDIIQKNNDEESNIYEDVGKNIESNNKDPLDETKLGVTEIYYRNNPEFISQTESSHSQNYEKLPIRISQEELSEKLRKVLSERTNNKLETAKE